MCNDLLHIVLKMDLKFCAHLKWIKMQNIYYWFGELFFVAIQ